MGVGLHSKRTPLKQHPLRLPGQSVQDEIDRLADEKLLFYVLLAFLATGMAIWEWWRSYVQAPYAPVLMTVFAVGAVAFSAFRIAAIRKRLIALRLGRDGERVVAETLDKLRSAGAVVFNDLQGGHFNVDHVVVSRHGLFAVETKTYSKRSGARITFDGKTLIVDGVRLDRDPIEQARANARWIASKIRDTTGKDLRVKPVVVFPGWFVNPVREQGGSDVWVLNPEALPSFVLQEPRSVSEQDFSLAVVTFASMARGA